MAALLVVEITLIANIWNLWKNPLTQGLNALNVITQRYFNENHERVKYFIPVVDYPKCDYALWNEPIDKPCPQCAWPILTLKDTKRSGRQIICPHEGCGYSSSED